MKLVIIIEYTFTKYWLKSENKTSNKHFEYIYNSIMGRLNCRARGDPVSTRCTSVPMSPASWIPQFNPTII